LRNQQKKEKNNKNTKLARKKRNLSLFLAQKKESATYLGWERRGRGSREKIIIDFHHLNVDDER
jgi:hypothetical protein